MYTDQESRIADYTRQAQNRLDQLLPKAYWEIRTLLPEEVRQIVQGVLEGYAQSRLDEAYGGGGGVGSVESITRLAYYISGYMYAKTGMISKCYEKSLLKQDPEYQQYLKLKEKFEKV